MPPRLTIAIPLHRAGRWVENVGGLIEKAPEWSEVVVSDATHEDDALERLRERFAEDPRVAFRPRAERLDWREHCNLLLAESESEYFCWMPQDDSVGPDEYFGLLVAALDANSEASLAFAPMSCAVRRGRGNPVRLRRTAYLPVPRGRVPRGSGAMIDLVPPRQLGASAPIDEALWLLENWVIAVAWRGVFRRELGRAIPTNGPADHIDGVWTFSTAMAGNLELVPEARYFKRFHESSAHQGFAVWKPRDQLSAYRAEVEARLGADTEASEAVMLELERFARSRERGRVKRLLQAIGWWISDRPRIAVERG